MIFMGVGYDDAAQPVQPFLDEGDVRQDEIDARQVRPRKRHAAINHDPFAMPLRAVAVETEIHADLADTAERQKYEAVFGAVGHGVLQSGFNRKRLRLKYAEYALSPVQAEENRPRRCRQSGLQAFRRANAPGWADPSREPPCASPR